VGSPEPEDVREAFLQYMNRVPEHQKALYTLSKYEKLNRDEFDKRVPGLKPHDQVSRKKLWRAIEGLAREGRFVGTEYNGGNRKKNTYYFLTPAVRMHDPHVTSEYQRLPDERVGDGSFQVPPRYSDKNHHMHDLP